MSTTDTWRGVLVAGTVAVAGAGLFGAAQAQETLQVAAVHASPVENAWNSRLHAALTAAEDAGKIDYVFSEGVAGPDYPRAMREYAEQGVDLVVGESYAVEREARRVASDYPDTAFLMGSSGKPQGDNFGTFGTWNHGGAYLAGMLAGAMTETGTVGSVAAVPIPEVNLLVNAFEAGVRETRPDATHLVTFIGTFFDPPKAREAGLAQIDAGADILFGERIGTADAAKERGVLAVGSLLNYTPRYPDTVFANAMWYFGPILDAALADVRAGEPTGRDYTPYALMPRGGSDIVYSEDMVPEAAAEAMEKRRAAILAGDFEVPVDLEKPE